MKAGALRARYRALCSDRGLLSGVSFALQHLLYVSLLCLFQILYIILLNISLTLAHGQEKLSRKGAFKS